MGANGVFDENDAFSIMISLSSMSTVGVSVAMMTKKVGLDVTGAAVVG